MFALNSIINTSHMDIVLENPSLYRICSNLLKVKNPSFGDINYLICQAMSSSTATMRFPGASNNSDLRKLCTNLIPFPRLHFIAQAQAPLMARDASKYEKIQESEIIQQLFDSRSFMSNADPKYGKILTGSVLFRGKAVSEGEVDKQLKKLTDKHSGNFVEWIPNRIMSTICSVNPPYKQASMSATALLNTTSISSSMQRILGNFEKMYARKAYVHWYTNEGMDIAEFDEAYANLRDLISEYQQYADAGVGDDEDEDEEMEFEKVNRPSSTASHTTRANSRMSHNE